MFISNIFNSVEAAQPPHASFVFEVCGAASHNHEYDVAPILGMPNRLLLLSVLVIRVFAIGFALSSLLLVL